eukprot:4316042-Karenia_brevis.AAC.1
MAYDRSLWRNSRQHFVFQALNLLLGEGHRAFGVHEVDDPDVARQPVMAMVEDTAPELWTVACQPSPTYTFNFADVDKHRAHKGLSWLKDGVMLQLVGDSRVLIDCLLGKAVAARQWFTPVQMAHDDLN